MGESIADEASFSTGFFINGNDRAALEVHRKACEREHRDLYSECGIRRKPRTGMGVDRWNREINPLARG